jgi:hypothetical protein
LDEVDESATGSLTFYFSCDLVSTRSQSFAPPANGSNGRYQVEDR